MKPTEKHSRGLSNVTNLDEVRRAKEQAREAEASGTSSADPALVASLNSMDHGNRRFDAEKVARIKAAIAAGEYEINPSRIADKFIEHDRNQ